MAGVLGQVLPQIRDFFRVKWVVRASMSKSTGGLGGSSSWGVSIE